MCRGVYLPSAHGSVHLEVLIYSIGMCLHHPSMIHIKTQLAFKFGWTPKVSTGKKWTTANGTLSNNHTAEIESDH